MRIFVFIVMVVLSGEAGFASNLDRSLSQLHHTSWTAKDGGPSQIGALAQTSDGYLWIGTARGLFRFDGVTFERYAPPPGMSLPSHNIYALVATSDGGLWISFRPSGVAFVKGDSLTVPSRPEELPSAQVYTLAADQDGRVWAGTHNGLELLMGSRWVLIGSDWNFPGERVWSLFVDRQGTLWVGTGQRLVFLRRGSRRFEPTSVNTPVVKIGQARDGRIWIAEMTRPLRPIDGQPRRWGGSARSAILFDRDGALWSKSLHDGGLIRVRSPESELAVIETVEGLTGNTGPILEDREGSVWVATSKGLDRFRYSHFVPVALPPNVQLLTLLPGADGDLYAGSAMSWRLGRIRGDEVEIVETRSRLASVTRDARGDTWWGGGGGIYRQRGLSLEFFPQPPFLGKDDIMWEVIRDDERGGLWVSVGDQDLIHFQDGVWSRHSVPAGLPQEGPSATFRDPQGRTWFGYTRKYVALLEGGRGRIYTRADGIDVGRIRVIRGSGAHKWFGGELGLALFRDGRFRSVLDENGKRLGTVTGIIETADGALWLNEMRGIIRLPPQEVRRILENPAHRAAVEVFDFNDGLRGSPQMNWTVSTAVETTDGRLWFATDNGLVWIDPRRMAMNRLPPPVLIRSLEADRQYLAAPGIVLPPGTERVHFRYTATSLSIPERVRFRYKLEGVDEQWQDAGSRREAFYNRLAPGDYIFRVIASNNDGVWNERGATLRFGVKPAWYQTNAFRVACAMLVLLSFWALFRLRVKQIEASAHARFNERLSERTRLAREIHDTLLQTIQGSKMVADDALDAPFDPARLRKAMQQLAGWLAQAMAEGRAALNSLRSSTTETNDLLEAMRRATESAMIPSFMNVTCSISGERRE
ncbi:MAG TPA: two-component regulator propeller domain-containing protein, partial [Thermoanaerobaculia bacterium]|nr:two-component regulator propeller domain-containing protein [Thermoanaerobaculia bacterium]